MNRPCEDFALTRIADFIQEWEPIAPWFGITSVDEKDIARSHPQQYRVQKRCMLQKWKSRKGDKATYRALVDIFTQADEIAVAHRIRDEIVEVRGQVPEVSIQQLQPTTAHSVEAGGNGITYALESEEWPLTKPSSTLASNSYSSHSARPRGPKKASADCRKYGVKKSNHEESMKQSEDIRLVCEVAADVINTTASIAGILGTVFVLAILGLTVAAKAAIGETIVNEATLTGVVVGTIISGIAIIGIAVGTIIGKFIVSSTTIFGVTITGGVVARTVIGGFAIITAAAGAIGGSMVHVGGIFLGTAVISYIIMGVFSDVSMSRLVTNIIFHFGTVNGVIILFVVSVVVLATSKALSDDVTTSYILVMFSIPSSCGLIVRAFSSRVSIPIGTNGVFMSGFTIIIAATFIGGAAGLNINRSFNSTADIKAYFTGIWISTYALGNLAGGALTGQKAIRCGMAIDSVAGGATIGSLILLPILPSVGFLVGALLGGSIAMMVVGGMRALANWRIGRNRN